MKKIIKWWSQTKTLKLLVYGEAWSGKTTFAVQAPWILFLDFERWLWELDVDRIECDRLQDAVDVFDAIRNKNPNLSTVKTIVIDSLTTLTRRERLAANPKNMNDRGNLKKSLNRLLDCIQACEINVIVTCLENLQNIDDVDDSTGDISATIKKFVPAVEWYKQDFTGVFDIVTYFYKDYDNKWKVMYLFDVEWRKYNYAKCRYLKTINNASTRDVNTWIEGIQTSEAGKSIQSEVWNIETSSSPLEAEAEIRKLDKEASSKIVSFIENNCSEESMNKLISNIATQDRPDKEDLMEYARFVYSKVNSIV